MFENLITSTVEATSARFSGASVHKVLYADEYVSGLYARLAADYAAEGWDDVPMGPMWGVEVVTVIIDANGNVCTRSHDTEPAASDYLDDMTAVGGKALAVVIGGYDYNGIVNEGRASVHVR